MQPQGELERELARLESQARAALTYQLEIGAFVETIFDCIDDGEKQPQWLKGLERTVFPDGRPAGEQAGTRFTQLVKQKGRLAEYQGLILVHQRPRRLYLRVGNRHFTALVDYRLASLGDRSRLDFNCRLAFHTLIGRMAGTLYSGSSRRVAIEQLVALKQFAEAGG
ncbi:MAG TPA: SRPBCC family protein [Planctomycetota bacterium]|nr:SRPBCC family protein [Planctomycetota bacterium]